MASNMEKRDTFSNDDGSPPVSEAPKKKSRLHWDEENLQTIAAEMEKAGPRMKIDEPKTPFHGSETGSSTSGSAHQSPPESPSFLPGEHLVEFSNVEENMNSGSSSPRSREEFNAKRRAHYRNEARWLEEWRKKADESEEINGHASSNAGNGDVTAFDSGEGDESKENADETPASASSPITEPERAMNGHQEEKASPHHEEG